MSDQVKRFIARLEGGFAEVVEARDYDALLAEREAMNKTIEVVLQEMRERRVNHGRNTSPTLIAWADRIDAALQGEQP